MLAGEMPVVIPDNFSSGCEPCQPESVQANTANVIATAAATIATRLSARDLGLEIMIGFPCLSSRATLQRLGSSSAAAGFFDAARWRRDSPCGFIHRSLSYF